MTVNAVAPYQGILHWVGQPAQGVSQATGQPWKSVQFVVKYIDSQMKEQFIVFDLTGVELVDRLLATPAGTEIRVSWRPSARQWTDQQGQTKWFAQYSAFGFVVVPQEQQQAPMPQPAPQPYGGYPQQPVYQQARPAPAPVQSAYQQAPPMQPQAPSAPAPAPAAPQNDDLPF